ncbi:MAG: glycosyltransferase [Alistipes sp.]|nr:glycosyltransferase [Alistipes sp.]
MKLSIVIPMYNVDKYIEKCLLSCINQDISASDYEIIVVNDGSLDCSMQIVSAIAKCYSNIRIIEQQNQGLSAARNNGFAISKGEYVWFVDSDDWIECNCLKRITHKLCDNIDILQLQYRLVYDDSMLNKDCYTIIDGIVTGVKQTLNGGLPAPAQFAIYRSDFLRENNLSFVLNIYHEDSEFKPRVTYLAKKIASDNDVCYNYYQREIGSITSSFTFKRAESIIFVCNSLYFFSKNLPLQIQKCFCQKIGLNLNTLFNGLCTLSKKEKNIISKQIFANKHLLYCMVKSGYVKYILEGLIFIVSIPVGLSIYSYFKHR